MCVSFAKMQLLVFASSSMATPELSTKVEGVGEVGGVARAANGWTPRCHFQLFEDACGLWYRACGRDELCFRMQ
jgi:hypothetical protein